MNSFLPLSLAFMYLKAVPNSADHKLKKIILGLINIRKPG
jgi:hypothetical protein